MRYRVRSLILLATVLAVAACGSSTASGQASGAPGVVAVGTVAPPTVEITPEETVVPADISAWITVAPVAQGFAAAFPGTPSFRNTTVAELNAPTALYSYTDPSDRTYQVARSRLPRGIVSSDALASLDRFRSAMLRTTLEGSSITYQRKTTFDSRPAVRYTLASGDRRSEGLLILDDQILYRISVSYDVDQLNRSFLEAFLGSFALVVM